MNVLDQINNIIAKLEFVQEGEGDQTEEHNVPRAAEHSKVGLPVEREPLRKGRLVRRIVKNRPEEVHRWIEGTHAVVRPATVLISIGSPRDVRASSGRPQRWWKSHVAGNWSESAFASHAVLHTVTMAARSAFTWSAESADAAVAG